MNSQTIRINNEIDALHVQNVKFAEERKYENITINLAKIKQLELNKLKINKVDELIEVMTFLNMEPRRCDHTNPDHQPHRMFNGQTGTMNDTTGVDKRLFKLMFEAIVELNERLKH